jgi:hypothetical protein
MGMQHYQYMNLTGYKNLNRSNNNKKIQKCYSLHPMRKKKSRKMGAAHHKTYTVFSLLTQYFKVTFVAFPAFVEV